MEPTGPDAARLSGDATTGVDLKALESAFVKVARYGTVQIAGSGRLRGCREGGRVVCLGWGWGAPRPGNGFQVGWLELRLRLDQWST